MKKYDIAIIGSGPGGYVAAIRAAQINKKVALIEKADLGGICLNWGCIPTKSLLHIAKHYDFMKNRSEEIGISIENLSFNLEKIVKHSRDTAAKLSSGVSMLMQKHKKNIDIFLGTATINSDKSINCKIKDKEQFEKIEAINIVIATGSSPIELKDFSFSDSNIWNYRNALVPKNLPNDIAIIGSGAIGIEFANFYNSMGSNVYVIEMQSSILPNEDVEISAIAEKIFIKKGINIFKNSNVKIENKTESKVKLSINNEKKIDVDVVLVAAGISGNIHNIGLENFPNIGVNDNSRFLSVDKNYQTKEKGIFAIGDVIGSPCLAHKAMHDAIECINKIFGKDDNIPNKSLIPSCTYSDPQIASIGITEKYAKEQNMDIKIGKFQGIGNGKSVVLGETESFVKVIFDKKTNELLGAHMIGHEVTEMIQGFNIIQYLEGDSNWLKKLIFAHPTVSEMMHEAILDADNESLHK
ncbi:dihydrolipoyl dehydrogenase [Anaplasmataceae bacterium AB001_6]|nr:dihydrolipoyl dehydrogenase [Anaplasmataceae bacterium AB001_6]